MNQTTQHTKAAAKFALLVTFEWGVSNVARYCRWDKDLVIGADTFTSLPKMSAKLNKAMSGGTDDATVELTIPITVSPVNKMVLPYKKHRYKVKIEEFSPGDDDSRRVLFYGTVGPVRARQASSTMARLTIKGFEARLKVVSIGLQALSTCPHTFGDDDCGFNLPAATLTGTVTEVGIDGIPNRISVSFSGSPNLSNARFSRGFISFDALPITIRQVVSEGTNPNPTAVFDMLDAVPPDWDTEEVSVAPGCRGRIEDCRDPFRDREESFLGAGYAMPAYNPGFFDAPDA